MVGRTIHKWHCSDAPCDGASDSESNIGDNIGTGQWDSSLTEDEMPF